MAPHSGPDVAQSRLLALKAKSVLNVLVVLFLLKIVLGIRWYHLFCTHVFRYMSKSVAAPALRQWLGKQFRATSL